MVLNPQQQPLADASPQGTPGASQYQPAPATPGSTYQSSLPIIQQDPNPLATYQTMQQQYGPLAKQPVPAPIQLNNSTFQGVADQLASVNDSHPLLKGSASPNPNSTTVAQGMSGGQIAAEVGKETLQQAIVDPIHQFIDAWQKPDKTEAVKDTLIGGAIIGGAIGLEALTGGAATPFIFAAGAALVAPSMVSAVSDEIQHPSDSNMVKAWVNVLTGVISVGSPVKAFRGVSSASRMMRAGMMAKKALATQQDATDLLLSGQHLGQVRDALKIGIAPESQMEVLASQRTDLEAQLTRLGVPIKGNESIQDLLNKTDQLSAYRSQYLSAQAEGDESAAAYAKIEYDNHLKEEVVPARLKVAHDWLFRVDNPYDHVLNGISDQEMQSLPSAMVDALQSKKSVAMGVIRGLGLGHANGGVQVGARSVLEHMALDRTAGGPLDDMNRLVSLHNDLLKESGMVNRDGTLDEERVEKALQGLEDKPVWDELLPADKLYATHMKELIDAMSVARLRRGTVANILPGFLERNFRAVSGPEGPAHKSTADLLNWERGTVTNASRIWKALGDIENGDLSFGARTRSEIVSAEQAQQKGYEASKAIRDVYTPLQQEINQARRKAGGLKAAVTRAESLLKGMRPGTQAHSDLTDRLNGAKASLDQFLQDFESQHDPEAARLVQKAKGKVEAAAKKSPLTQELIQGSEAVRVSMARFVNEMHEAAFRDDLQSIADQSMLQGKDVFGPLPEKLWGAEIAHLGLRDKGTLHVLPETVFEGGATDAPSNAANAGYVRIPVRGIGRPGDLNYRPQLYAHESVAGDILRAMDSAQSASEMRSGVLGAIYKVEGYSKGAIMMSPAIHALNVAGRTIAWILNDPSVAGTALKMAFQDLKDPQMYAELRTQFNMAGGKHADQFHVGKHLQLQQKEQDGQHSWPGALRVGQHLLEHVYQDQIERGFWSSVDFVQMAAFRYAKHVFSERMPSANAAEIERAAAHYANQIGGQVNPLYVNRIYQHMKNLIWFAPSYWATFMRSVSTMIPGAAKLSGFLAKAHGGAAVRYGAVPFKAIDQNVRKELVRQQRSYVMTYIATAIATADLMNVMFGGRHLWENDQGRMMDINVDKAVGAFGGTPIDAQGRHSYVSGFPIFKQGSDVFNALGLGHDYGFAHTFNDPVWQKQDLAHKMYMAAGAAYEGGRREASTKTSPIAQAGFGAATGDQLAAFAGQGVQQKYQGPIGRWESLLSLVPMGQAGQTALEFDPKNPRGQMVPGKQLAESAGTQLLGIPSVYQMAAEHPSVDTDKITVWNNTRNQIHDQLTQASQSIFAGDLPLSQYAKIKHDASVRLLQNDSDTFGSNSPSASLAGRMVSLSNQYGLNDPNLSSDQWMARKELFDASWNQVLEGASPQARATWWETRTAQWTDADYLEWESSQLKDALMASIDHQGGNHIRAYQLKIANLESEPLTTAERTQIEQADPYYYTYRTVMKNLSKNSALGALLGGFSAYGNTAIAPAGSTPGQVQALADVSSGPVLSPETAAELGKEARQVGQSPEVAQAGGEAQASPEFVGAANQAIQGSAQAGPGVL